MSSNCNIPLVHISSDRQLEKYSAEQIQKVGFFEMALEHIRVVSYP